MEGWILHNLLENLENSRGEGPGLSTKHVYWEHCNHYLTTAKYNKARTRSIYFFNV